MNATDEGFGPLGELWCSQETAPVQADVSRIRTDAERLDARIQRRNRHENLAVVAVTGFFLVVAAVEAVGGNAVSAGGAVLVCASGLWVRFALRRWGRWELTPGDLERDGQSFLALYRRELVRQRRLVLHAWLWYVLPIMTGLLLVDWGRALDRGVPVETWLGSIMFLVLAAVAFVVVLLNLVAARDLTRRIVELRSVEEV
jgi:hypothetical protein